MGLRHRTGARKSIALECATGVDWLATAESPAELNAEERGKQRGAAHAFANN
jgi:hypothetical protein